MEEGFPKPIMGNIVASIFSGTMVYLIHAAGGAAGGVGDEAQCTLVPATNFTNMLFADLSPVFCQTIWQNNLPRQNITAMSFFNNEEDVRALVVESGNKLYVKDPIHEQYLLIGEIAAPCLAH